MTVKKTLKKLLWMELGFFLLLFIVLAGNTMAAPTCPPGSPGICLTIDDVVDRIVFFSCWLGTMAMFVTVIMLVVYGIMFALSQGDTSKVGKAKDAFVWGLIGAFVIFGAYVIIATVAYFVGDTTFSMPFNC